MRRSGNQTVLALITGPLLFGVYACGSLLGITDGTARDDAGLDAPIEATVGDEPPVTKPDGGADASGEACVSRDVCVDHCGVTLDECGLTVKCPNECGDGKQCNAGTHACECVSNPAWCTGRCGKTKDNCGKAVDCSTCPGSQACDPNTNSCGGCVPNNAVACTGKNCGPATNNCGQVVDCGTCTGQCNGGTCCVPQPVCSGKSCGIFDNGCNQQIACGGNGGMCPAGGMCTTSSTCCFDDGTACQGKGCGMALNNCGQQVQCAYQCSVDQSCGTASDPNACCTGSCGNKQCNESNGCATNQLCFGAACTTSTQCCFGESCRNITGTGKCQPGSCDAKDTLCSPGAGNPCCFPYQCIFNSTVDGGMGLEGGTVTTAKCQ